jgi:8-oxo-dGTP pyrophosphatase MutT (NUDIX family)
MTERGPWKTVTSREIYRDAWIALQIDDVIRPDGRPGTHSIIQVKPGIAVIAMDAERNLYLAEEFHYGVGRWMLEGVCGGCDPGETPLETARRELREELGIIAARWTDLGAIDPITSSVVAPGQLFLAEDLSFVETAHEGTELIRCVKVSWEEALRMAADGTISHGVTLALLLRIALLQKGV